MQDKNKSPTRTINMMFLLFIILAVVNFVLLSHEEEQSPILLSPVASMAKEAGH